MLAASLAVTQVADSIDAVTITAEKGMVVSMTDTIRISGGDISEALQILPSLYVNDYGGLSGLRSVSMRGLGSTHTAIFIDGIRVNNLQTGQADLGMTDLPVFGSTVVDYAQNSLNFKTERPVFGHGPVSGRLSMEAASFDTWMPAARLDLRLSDRIAMSLSASAVLTEGDFIYGDGQRRENNDLRQLRAGLDLFGSMQGGEWQAKLYWNGAGRTSPGAVDWPSVSTQNDRNVFVQGRLQKRFSRLYSLNLSAKAAMDRLDYADEWSESDYDQKELQLNSSHSFDIFSWWRLSLSASVQWNRLSSSLYEGGRTSVISAAATSFSLGCFRAELALEYDGTFEDTRTPVNTLSPSLGLSWSPARALELRAFARRACRVPTFNELYYPGYGNTALRPEDAWLTDLGIRWSRRLGTEWKLDTRLDGFYNLLKDKIVSAPTEENPSIWLPYNVGRVEAVGLDASLALRWSDGLWNAGMSAAYSLQDAEDRTPESSSYGSQISGTPRHSLNLAADVTRKGWQLSAVWSYRGGRMDSTGELPDWNTLDLRMGRKFSCGDGGVNVYLKARNLTDCRYEIVRGYPAPGRSLLFGAEFKF